jgi:hypothetical protein
MTRTLPTFPKSWVVLPGLLVLALLVAGVAFQASGTTDRAERFVLVADAASGTSPAEAAAVVRARERATGAEGEFRIARTPTEQLSVTHLFAAKGYDTVIGVGLDERIAVAPVAERFPATLFLSR